MEILVKKVENGAEYEDRMFDFWVEVQTQNGKELRIFDSLTFDLRGMESTKINVLLLAGFIAEEGVANNNFQKLHGQVVNQEELNQTWIKKKNDIFQKSWLGLKCDEGIYLLSPKEMEEKGLKVGQIVDLNVGRIDLIAIG
jgi:hypothetical protein